MTKNLKRRNFWSRHEGTLYAFTGRHPYSRRLKTVYVGKTFQKPWTRRIEQHMWGGGRYDSEPKPWADTIPGWRSDGTAAEIIAAGGVRVVWARRCSPFGLRWREILLIWTRRPIYNIQHASHLKGHVPKWVAVAQRTARDRGWPAPALTRTAFRMRANVAIAAMLIVGLVGAWMSWSPQLLEAASSAWDYRGLIVVGAVALTVAWWQSRRGGRRRVTASRRRKAATRPRPRRHRRR